MTDISQLSTLITMEPLPQPEWISGTLIERMEMEFLELDPQRVSARMPVAGNTQPAGLLHGGANAALAETLGSVAAIVIGGENSAPVGLEINATHHSAARAGFVYGLAVPLKVGRRISSFDITIIDGDSRLICTARLLCLYSNS